MIYFILVWFLWSSLGYVFSLMTGVALGYVAPVVIVLGVFSMKIIKRRLKK